MRQRLDAIVAALIGVVDSIDGDTDLEPGAEDESAQCDDEGLRDDIG